MMYGVKAALLVALTLALAIPAASLATDAPNPAAEACKAEYLQLGADAFKAKYGATEPYQACISAHGGTTATPPTASGPEAACKAEYLKLGADAFKAKYGADEPYRACLKAQGAAGGDGTKPAPSLAPRLCELEYKQIGADAFAAKYGSSDAGKRACLQATAAQAAAIASRCNSADDPERCVKQALGGDKPAAGDDAAVALAKAYCAAKAKSSGTDSRDRIAACVKAALSKARSLVAACKAASDGKKDAFKQCVTAAVRNPGSR